MPTKKHGIIVETPTEARQAEPGPSVLALLTISTCFAVLILGICLVCVLPNLTDGTMPGTGPFSREAANWPIGPSDKRGNHSHCDQRVYAAHGYAEIKPAIGILLL